MVRNCIIANVLMLCDQPKVQGMIMCVKAYDFQVHIKAGQSWTQDANLPKCFSSLAWLYTNFRLKEDIIVVSKVTDSGDLCLSVVTGMVSVSDSCAVNSWTLLSLSRRSPCSMALRYVTQV